MIRALIVTALTLLAVVAPAQQQVCHGYNYTSNSASLFQVLAGVEQGILYVVPGTAPFLANQVQLFFANPPGTGGVISITPAQGTMRLETADPVTGLPSGTVLASGPVASGNTGIIAIGAGWRGFSFPSMAFASNQLIWVIFTVAPYPGPGNLGVQNGGPDTVTSSRNTGNGWGALSVADRFKLRFRSPNCNPAGSGPQWITIGGGCVASTGFTPTLTPNGLPALGASVSLTVGNAIPGQMAHLFFSIGVSPGGATVLPNGCPLWLDWASFLSFVQLGSNPLLQLPVNATGSASFPLGVPVNVGIIGVPIGFQAAVDDPGVQGFSATEAELAIVGW
ncbi:MAG: hypothetical protein CMJ90_13325 [Planctomycetes bacterium]|nr:hypothetical protein [Planctomycetota bacterium]